jgi:hypothetical protein
MKTDIQNFLISNLETRTLQDIIDLLLQEQIKVLFESQAKQLEILKSIENKVTNS